MRESAMATVRRGAIIGGNRVPFARSSDAPIALNDDLRRVLLRANHAKSAAGRLKALTGVRPQHLVPEIPRNAEPRTGLSMGDHAAKTALAWEISREAQDELAARSHQR